MNLRSVLNQKPAVAFPLALGVLGLAMVMLFWTVGGNGHPTPDQAYYYDLKTGEVFVGERDLGLLDAGLYFERENGNPAAAAHLYACGSCDDEGERFLAYVETFSREARRMPQIASAGEGRIVSRDGQRWASRSSPEGREIMNVRCPEGGEETPTRCWP